MPRTPPSAETDSPVAPCKGCGKKILWAVTAKGKRIPLDQVAPTYLLRVDERQDGLPVADRSRAYVSHFATCANANEFSGKNVPKNALEAPQEGIKREIRSIPYDQWVNEVLGR